mmetsp:Transcript_39339/g.77410  ORF Transcript_39339/g.77410 Transcript_39339/m.77410 type:complete len:157 (+) Transcript_39339:145-615(+)
MAHRFRKSTLRNWSDDCRFFLCPFSPKFIQWTEAYQLILFLPRPADDPNACLLVAFISALSIPPSAHKQNDQTVDHKKGRTDRENSEGPRALNRTAALKEGNLGLARLVFLTDKPVRQATKRTPMHPKMDGGREGETDRERREDCDGTRKEGRHKN